MTASLVTFVVPALLAISAGWDLTSFTIPNFLSFTLIAVFAVFAFAVGMPLGLAGWHVLAGAIALAVGFALFAFGFVGGGDAKLFAAIGLWLGFAGSSGADPTWGILEFALIASLFGGALALLLLTIRKVPLPAMFSGQGWLMRLHDAKSGVPYGVALAAGALVTLPHTDVFRLAML